jgi:hypothetical protein
MLKKYKKNKIKNILLCLGHLNEKNIFYFLILPSIKMSFTQPINPFYGNFRVRGPQHYPFTQLTSLGNTGTNVPVTHVQAGTITISPTAAGQTFVLPQATQIINAIGNQNVNVGTTNVSSNTVFPLTVYNFGTQPAILAANQTGSSGEAIMIPAASALSATGAATLAGATTQLHVRLTNVSSSANGMTGSYTLF